MEVAAFLLLGLAIGAVAGWFFKSNRGADSQLQETRQQLAQVNRQRDAAVEQLREESSRRGSFEALAAGIPDLQREIEARSMSIAQQQRTILEVTKEKEGLAATIEAERRGFEEKLKLLEDAKKALSDAFETPPTWVVSISQIVTRSCRPGESRCCLQP